MRKRFLARGVTEPVPQVLDPIEFDERDGQREALPLGAGLLDAEAFLEAGAGRWSGRARCRRDLLLEFEDASGQRVALAPQLLKLGTQGAGLRHRCRQFGHQPSRPMKRLAHRSARSF
jgi:hypothetical protein